MRDETQATLVTLAVVALVLDVIGRCVPPMWDVDQAAPLPATVARTRAHMTHAGVVGLAIGAGASWLVRSPWPFLGAAGVVVWSACRYDTAARRTPVR